MAGIGTRKLKVTVDGDEFTAQVSKCLIRSAATESDFVTFADAAAGGGRDYFLDVKAVQDAETGTFWDIVWSQLGAELEVVVMPYGNATPSATEPHFEGTIVVREPDGDLVGGEANRSTSARQTIEVSFPFTEKPTKVTA